MANELVINTTSHETRVALIENGTIAELYIERSRRSRGSSATSTRGESSGSSPACRRLLSISAWRRRPFSMWPMSLTRSRSSNHSWTATASRKNRQKESSPGHPSDAPDRGPSAGGAGDCWSRYPRSRSAPRGHGSPPTSPCPVAIWSTCRPSIMSASPGASRTKRSASACGDRRAHQAAGSRLHRPNGLRREE